MVLNDTSKKVLSIATFFVALSVALGAFGAHGLKSIVNEHYLKIYQTGVQYQFYNALGLLFLGLVINFKNNIKAFKVAIYVILFGMIIFSFSLYSLVLLNLPILGAITPIGGMLMIIGWLMASYLIYKD